MHAAFTMTETKEPRLPHTERNYLVKLENKKANEKTMGYR